MKVSYFFNYLPKPKNTLLIANQLKNSFSSSKVIMALPTLETVQKVDIDSAGVFKYILIKVHDKSHKTEAAAVTIVRGYKRCEYHTDIFEEVQQKLHPLDCEPLGGGRISHLADEKKIHIYGYSQGYGKADHDVTAKLIKDHYQGYTITVSDEGY